MSDGTIIISPIPEACTVQLIKSTLKQFSINRVSINAKLRTAYVQFHDPNDIQALALKYQDCKIKQLNNAEVSYVDRDFTWERDNGIKIDEDCLISIKNCSNLDGLSEGKIKNIFKKFTILKVVKYEDLNEIVVEFGDKGELQLLDTVFDDLKIVELGPLAAIDPDHPIDAVKFTQKWKKSIESLNKNKENTLNVVKQVQKITVPPKNELQQKLQQKLNTIKQGEIIKEAEKIQTKKMEINEVNISELNEAKKLEEIKAKRLEEERKQKLKQQQLERSQFREKKQRELQEIKRIEQALRKEQELRQKSQEEELIKLQTEGKIKASQMQVSPSKKQINLSMLHSKQQINDSQKNVKQGKKIQKAEQFNVRPNPLKQRQATPANILQQRMITLFLLAWVIFLILK